MTSNRIEHLRKILEDQEKPHHLSVKHIICALKKYTHYQKNISFTAKKKKLFVAFLS